MALKAVGFDIDGTLYPDHRASMAFSAVFFHPYALNHRVLTNTKAYEIHSDDSVIAEDADEAEVIYFAEERNCSLERARDIRDRIIYKGWEKYFRGIKIYPDVRESLLRLKDAGLKLAALSDFPVGRKLEFFGLEGIFDVVLGFPESGRLKPRHEPFLHMAEGLNTNPEDIIYVGNKLDYDVRGAENAGMRGALIGSPGRRAPSDVTKYSDYRHLAESILSEVAK